MVKNEKEHSLAFQVPQRWENSLSPSRGYPIVQLGGLGTKHNDQKKVVKLSISPVGFTVGGY